MSNHAGLEGPLDYVIATGVSSMLVDNSRHGNVIELTDAIRTELRVAAVGRDCDRLALGVCNVGA